jgi:hypothetical protein
MSNPISRRMTVLIAVGVLVGGLVIGAIAGAYFSANVLGRTFAQLSLDLRGAEVREHIVLLEALRSRRSDKAITHLEYALDDDLLSYNTYLTNTDMIVSATAKAGIKAARNYRARFPSPQQSPEVAEAIRKVLASSLPNE